MHPPDFGRSTQASEAAAATTSSAVVHIATAAATTLISQLAAASTTSVAGAPSSTPKPDDENNGECKLLGPFAILVQGALGILALVALVYKRWKERPQRPVKVWAFDASKQVFGSALLHVANLAMSLFSSGQILAIMRAASGVAADNVHQPNPCSFYLLNLAIDTTIGIPILVVILKVLHAGANLTPLARPPESIKSGYYGDPPRASWWLKQAMIYFVGLLGMKVCVFFIFQLCPWIVRVGDWALRWTEGNEAVQVAFVMLIFPLIMNAMQYYIIDTFIKGKESSKSEEDRDRTMGGEGERDHEHGALLSGRESEDHSSAIDEEDEATKIPASHESAKPALAVHLKEDGRVMGRGGPGAGERSTPDSGGNDTE